MTGLAAEVDDGQRQSGQQTAPGSRGSEKRPAHSTTTKRTEDPNFRIISYPPEEDQEFYNDEYEKHEEEEEVADTTSSTAGTTSTPSAVIVDSGYQQSHQAEN